MGRRVSRVGGFSVMEAIIVLAITGLALTLVFSIGSRASEMGFRLGRRALGVADSQIATDSFRVLVSGIALPPFDMPAAAPDGVDYAFRGNATHFEGVLVSTRATPCVGAGPAGRVSLSLDFQQGHAGLGCALPGRAPVQIADLGPAPARFSYSVDGAEFTDAITLSAGPPASGMPGPDAQLRRVFIRLSNADGSVQTVALATSGRPIPWAVFDPRTAF